MLAAVALLAVAPLPRPLAAAQARLPVPLRQAMERIVWTPARVDSLILALPQVETHLHLDGALSPRTIRELAIQQNYKPLAQLSVSQIARKVVVQKKRDSLGEVLQAFRTIYPLLRTPQAVEEMAYQAVAAAKRQRVMYFEGRFAPALHTTPTFSQEQVLEAVLRGLERGRRDTGVRCGVIICLLRGIPGVTREDNAQMARLAIAYKDRGVVGLDLAGNEAAEPLSDFAEFFRQAKQAGLRTTAHVGEVPGSKDIETALELGVDRLGHATLLAKEPALTREVLRRGLPIEVNLTSNLRTNAVADLKQHPLRSWYEAGIPVTLSTDDPGIFGITLQHEYRLLPRLRFSAQDIATVAYEGIDALFLPEADKQALRERFEKGLARTLKRIAKQPPFTDLGGR